MQLHREDRHVLLLALTGSTLDGLELVTPALLRRSFDLHVANAVSGNGRGNQPRAERTWDLIGSKRGFCTLVFASVEATVSVSPSSSI